MALPVPTISIAYKVVRNHIMFYLSIRAAFKGGQRGANALPLESSCPPPWTFRHLYRKKIASFSYRNRNRFKWLENDFKWLKISNISLVKIPQLTIHVCHRHIMVTLASPKFQSVSLCSPSQCQKLTFPTLVYNLF